MASNQTRPNCIFVSSAWIVWWFLDSKGPKSKYGNGRPFWQFMIAKMADQVWNNHKQSKRTVIRTDKTGGSSLELQVRDRKKSFRFFFSNYVPSEPYSLRLNSPGSQESFLQTVFRNSAGNTRFRAYFDFGLFWTIFSPMAKKV